MPALPSCRLGDTPAVGAGLVVERFSGYLRGESYGLPERGTGLHRRVRAELSGRLSAALLAVPARGVATKS